MDICLSRYVLNGVSDNRQWYEKSKTICKTASNSNKFINVVQKESCIEEQLDAGNLLTSHLGCHSLSPPRLKLGLPGLEYLGCGGVTD